MDGVEDQIYTITPFLNDLQKNSYVKKDKSLTDKVQSALNSFQYQDLEPAVDLLANLLQVKDKEVKSICFQAFSELFTSKQFDFFLSQNHAISISHSLIEIIRNSKLAQSLEAIQCFTFYLLSPNQQLYLHNEELSYIINEMFEYYDQTSSSDLKKSVETLFRRFFHAIRGLASKSKGIVDELVTKDFQTIVASFVKLILKSFSEEATLYALGIIHDLIFEAPPQLVESKPYREALLVELPELFINYSLKAPTSVYNQLFLLFKQYVALGNLVITSFPAIIEQMIIPSFDKKENPLRAIQLLQVFSDNRSFLINVFAMSDCSSIQNTRVFETTIHSISRIILEECENLEQVEAGMKCILAILSSFRKFYIITKPGMERDGSQERFVLEQKMTVEGCAKIFNESPKKGIISIINSNLAENNPKSIASFLKSCKLLDAEKVSDFLSNPNNTEFLAEYINTFNFKDMTLDNALRELCSSFRLPGESQQIDRVMMAFASKYHADNEFMSDDAAYVISFSIIMLHTDIHNPNITHKISADQWIANTRNVKEACEVDISVLQDIYDRVLVKPMKLKHATLSPQGEAERIKKRGRKQLQQLMELNNVKITREILIIIIERLWATFFAVFSFCLTNPLNESITNITLECCNHLVFFLSMFSMSKDLNSVIQFLTTFAVSTDQNAGLKTIITITKEDGDFLGMSWLPILQLISNVMRAVPTSNIEAIDTTAPEMPTPVLSEVPVDEIDSIFFNSPNLKRFSFICFLKSLCEVSTNELFMNPPSLFSLQKIIETSKLNTSRVRFVWSQAWEVLSSHFCRVGCIPHEELAMYTIDGLRQVVQNISQDQDKWHHFQRESLNPFFVIYQNQSLEGARKYTVQCLSQFVGQVPLSTAWDVLLDMFEPASRDSIAYIVETTFQILEAHIATIPVAYHTKLVNDLLLYSKQKVVPSINPQSMAYAVTFALKLEPTSLALFQSVNNALKSCTPEVLPFASNLYFSLIPRINQSVSWEVLEEEHIMPLFTSAKKILQLNLIQNICLNLIPIFPVSISLIPRVTTATLEIGDTEELVELARDLVQLSKNEQFQKPALDQLILLLNNNTIKIEVIRAALEGFDESVTFFDAIDICVQQAINFNSLDILFLGLTKIFAIKAEEKIDRLAEIVISTLSFLNIQKDHKTSQVITYISKELSERKYSFLKEKRFEFNSVLIQFYMNESLEIRSIIKDIAQDSQFLFK